MIKVRGKEHDISTIFDGSHGVTLMQAYARIGTVSYLNAMPLLLPLEKKTLHSKYDFIIKKAPPARLAKLIHTAEIDVALLSVVEPMKERRHRIIDGMCICSNGPTLSVQIFHKGDPSQIKTLGLDYESKTSNILAQVILHERYGIRPENVIVRDPNEKTLDDVDAFVAIGDKTFNLLLNTDMPHIDMGEAWKEITGLPVVYAVWVMAPHFKDRDIIDVLRRSTTMGLQMLDEVIPRISRTRDLPMDLLTNYFHKNVNYNLGVEEKKGIAKLFQLGADMEILPPVRKLEYYYG